MNYKFYRDDKGRAIIEHTIYPRFTAEICTTYRGQVLPVLFLIQNIDKARAGDLAKELIKAKNSLVNIELSE